jgi:hypothetical protein
VAGNMDGRRTTTAEILELARRRPRARACVCLDGTVRRPGLVAMFVLSPLSPRSTYRAVRAPCFPVSRIYLVWISKNPYLIGF